MEDERSRIAMMVEAQRERTRKVAEASSFDALYEVLNTFDMVQGSHRGYTGKEIAERIALVRAGKQSVGSVTNTYGIRDKVQELIRQEHGEE